MASKALTISGITVACAAMVLLLSNPSLTDFKAQRAAEDGVSGITCNAVQTSNYVVFSQYEYRCMMSTKKYVGVLGNYYELDANKQA